MSTWLDSGEHVSDLVFARNCSIARMLPGEAELVSEWTGLSWEAKSVKRFERSNGPDIALYNNYLYLFVKRGTDRKTGRHKIDILISSPTSTETQAHLSSVQLEKLIDPHDWCPAETSHIFAPFWHPFMTRMSHKTLICLVWHPRIIKVENCIF